MTTANLDGADLSAALRGGLIHEDVMNSIWDISKIPLPFTDSITSDTISNAAPTWALDLLPDPLTDNKVVDGSDAGTDDSVLGTRVGNHAQIATKTVRVSTRADASDTIGKTRELSYQVMMRQRSLRRDVEAQMLTQQASVVDDGDSVAGQSAGFPAWLETNALRGATGVDGGYDFASGLVDAPVDGTARPNSETLVRAVQKSVYIQGGDANMLMAEPDLIEGLSTYLLSETARVANLQSDVNQQESGVTASGSVNLFITDFGGTLAMISNRIQAFSASDATHSNMILYDPEFVRQSFMTGYRVDPVAKTGLAENRLMHVDYTLKVLNEAAHGVIADIDPTEAVIA